MPKNKIKYSILRNGEFGCGSMFDLLPIKDVEECKIAANKFTSTYMIQLVMLVIITLIMIFIIVI